MVREPVRSSRVREIGYDPATLTLEVAFPPSQSTGVSRVYTYTPVLPDTYEQLKKSESIGRAFSDLIVKAKIPYHRGEDVVLESRDVFMPIEDESAPVQNMYADRAERPADV